MLMAYLIFLFHFEWVNISIKSLGINKGSRLTFSGLVTPVSLHSAYQNLSYF